VSFKIGRRFGILTVKQELVKDALYLCDCKCGWRLEVFYSLLANGVKLDCGLCRPYRRGGRKNPTGHVRRYFLKRRDRRGKKIFKYKTSAEINSWAGMKWRCLIPTNPNWEHYGGRGITVCKRWLLPNTQGFRNFIADLGPRPKGKSLDRINVQGHYEPTNCCWSTAAKQRCNQRRIIFRNKRMTKVEKVKQMEERVRLMAAGHFDGMSFDGEVPETF
jgi:hypothetical protein